ncbi:acetyltransferase [Deinococcus hopiensis]|uniref:Transferase hexapeptide (Six repeat-containing protein) n=1 Tax=Deinococcus hopiensis KR-140 TaxID=695939 RepID=A0A1W1UH21_9DEIO|nr:acetyltransferase [Deinococcus hopiensis]SMB80418.1 transferase hexapeptide (six repeat-containing protein) [Deinococcus hopiensis KR-140]
MSDILVVGAGGHAKVVIATLRAAGGVVGSVLDDNPASWGTEVLGCPVLGGTERLEGGEKSAILAIGSNRTRQAISARFPEVEWVTVVHPAATVHRTAHLGAGTVIFAGAVVQPDAWLGNHVIINTGATVDHDCVLEDYVHMAPGSNLAGNVQLAEGVFLGIGSSAVPGVQVGAWTTVGAGGVVVKNLPAGVTATGIPARPRIKQERGEA